MNDEKKVHGGYLGLTVQSDLSGKIRKIMQVSKRVHQKQMRDALGLSESEFNNHIFDWAGEFHFQIDGDYINFEGADVEHFIAELDRQFANWGNQEAARAGKVEQGLLQEKISSPSPNIHSENYGLGALGLLELPEEVPGDTTGNLTILKVFCEKCHRAIRINIDKEKMPKPVQYPFTFTYMHGAKSPAGRHGIVLKLDDTLSLLGVKYVNDAGQADVNIEEDVDIRKQRYKVGPWQPDEVATLKAEMAKGTPSQPLSRMLSRTIRDIECKMEQLK